ncbi:MAG: MAPEG family protein [Pseudobdellovibrionaceae bacterium]
MALPLTTLLLLWAIFAQGFLAILILFRLRTVRVAAFRNGEVKEIARYDPAGWPEKARNVQNAYANQFEMPVLFYVACLLALQFGQTGWLMVVFAWAFVVTRYIHAGVHVTTNKIRHRFPAFLAGVICLIVIWVYLALTITLA